MPPCLVSAGEQFRGQVAAAFKALCRPGSRSAQLGLAPPSLFSPRPLSSCRSCPSTDSAVNFNNFSRELRD
eukprot:766626-Rhodomonas_salina.1